jgi:hypothetical protein
VRVVGDPAGIAEGCGDVHLRRRAAQAELFPGTCVAEQAGSPGKRADRRRPLIEAGAAELLGLDQGDVGAELTSLQRRGGPGGSATEYENLHHRATVPGQLRTSITPNG